jgi:SRSO17 transposase
MDVAAFDRVATTFAAFHAQFAPLFGRDETQVHSEQYLRGLFVQHADRRNAENLAEAIAGASPRALQRFVTDSPWEDSRVLTRLQRVVGAHLSAPDGVFVLDDSGFPKQGTHSVGVGHQYCGQVGKVTNCQTGVFLAYVSSRGHALVDARLYLPRAWIADPARCRAAGVPGETPDQSKPELGRQLLQAARERGQLAGPWVTADEAYGQIPSFRDGLDDDGWWYVLEVPRTTPVFTTAAATAIPAGAPRGRRPTKPRLVAGEAPPTSLAAVAAALAPAAWQRLTVAEGAQGPRTYEFATQRVWESRAGLPGRACWALWRRNLDGSELKHYLSIAPPDTPLPTLGRVASWRWPVETEFETLKQEVGLDEYEVRGWRGWHHHITMALLAGAFLLCLEQEWGGKHAPGHAAANQPRAAGTAAPAGVDPARPAGLAVHDASAQRGGQTRACQPTPFSVL